MGWSEEEEMMTMMRYVKFDDTLQMRECRIVGSHTVSIKMFVLHLKTPLLRDMPSHRPPLMNASRLPAAIFILYHPFVLLKSLVTKRKRPAREDETRSNRNPTMMATSTD